MLRQLPGILVVFLFYFPISQLFTQNQNSCQDGHCFSQIISGSCQRILPNNPVRTYTVSRLRDTEGSVLALANGELLTVWTKFTKDGLDDSAGWIVGRRSTDKGRTWGDEFAVSGVWGMQNCMSPSLLQLANGELLLFVLAKHDQYEIDLLLWRSTDNGHSWSCPMEVNDGLQQSYHVMNNDRVIQLEKSPHQGRIICPLAFSPDVKTSASRSSSYFKCIIFYSDNGGLTWEKGNALTAPSGYKRGIMEPAVVELENGDLMMLMRTRNKKMLKSISTDGGVNWSPARILQESAGGADIVTTESPASIKRIPSTGDLLLIYSNGIGKSENQDRSHLVFRLSSDDGVNWTGMKSLENTAYPMGFSYVSIAFHDEQVLLSYYTDVPASKASTGIRTFSQKFRSLPVGWFYDHEKVGNGTIEIALSQKNLLIENPNLSMGPGEVMVYDTAGQLVWQKKITSHQKKYIFSLKQAQLPAGIYLVSLQSPQNKLSRKIVLR